MTTPTTTQRSEAAYGRWSASMDDLVTYRYLGCRSEVVDAERATGHMTIRSDMRWSAGLLGTPLAVAMLDTAGISIDGIRFAALTHVALHIYEDGARVERIQVDGEVTRIAKRSLFTECVVRDDADHDRVVMTGTADWASMGDVRGYKYTDPGNGVPDVPPMPPLIDAYQVQLAHDGTYAIRELSTSIGTSLLHHGPQMAAVEWHAHDLAADASGGTPIWLNTFDVRLLRGGTRPPFVTRGRAAGLVGDTIWAMTELVDDAGDVVTRGSLTFRTLGT
jgi:hypothetical protein